jgi:hypothetical protein
MPCTNRVDFRIFLTTKTQSPQRKTPALAANKTLRSLRLCGEEALRCDLKALRGSLVVAIILVCASVATSQSTVDVGGIVTMNYVDGGGESPLRHNDGLPSFELIGDLFLSVRISDEASAFLELESVRGWNVQLYAGALRYKLDGERLKIEAGKFVAPFGNFLPRRFAPQNFLYGFPLHYEYRTGLATDDVPESNQELLAARGTGHGDYAGTGALLSHHEMRFKEQIRLQRLIANSGRLPPRPATGHIVAGNDGVKLIAKEAYLTGVQLFGKLGWLGYSLGLANGSLSNPTDLSVSQRPMIFGRVHVQPAIGLTLGFAAASGNYLNRNLVQSHHADLQPEKYRHTIAGVDIEYSRGYFVFFGEGAFSRWTSPFLDEALDAMAFSFEGRYKILPRLFVAARYGRIGFSEIADAQDMDADGSLREPWEFPIRRFESAVGYSLSRQAIVKAVWQNNRTTGDPRGDPADNLTAIQMSVFY